MTKWSHLIAVATVDGNNVTWSLPPFFKGRKPEVVDGPSSGAEVFGAEGWELVSHNPTRDGEVWIHHLAFKRPLQ